MSGTSLDGLDLALCEFGYESVNTLRAFKILHAETVPYDKKLKSMLAGLMHATAEEVVRVDFVFGRFIGEHVKNFLIKNDLKADFVASHGHTVFHRPEEGYTLQVGQGATIAATAGLPTVCDFRSGDVSLGGQGAPLVPIGDRLLFSEYDLCLNIGGIANISFEYDGKRVAFDVCPANIILNELAMRTGAEYDFNGDMARSSKIDAELLTELNKVPYYEKSFPKSLGKEYVEEFFSSLLSGTSLHVPDLLATYTEHIAVQVGEICRFSRKEANSTTLFVTGGGAFNKFLMERIKHHAENVRVIVPDTLTVQFKEALIFAFLGILRIRQQSNCLASVTGASRDGCGGGVYLP